jgi:hypothetical protein
LDRIRDNPPAFQNLFTLIVRLGLFPVPPIHIHDIPAADPSLVFHDRPKAVEDFMGIGPHSGIFLFVFPGTAESQSHNRQGTGKGPACFSISPQASTESSHGFDDFVVFPPQLLLPDRKNGLASMETLLHHL